MIEVKSSGSVSDFKQEEAVVKRNTSTPKCRPASRTSREASMDNENNSDPINDLIFSHLSHPKRFSLIDRGKSWAKQFIRLNKLSSSSIHAPTGLVHHRESCDSGIDLSTAISSKNTTMSTSSSCSFIMNKSPNSELSNPNNDILLSSSNNTDYDPNYSSSSSSSNANSKSSNASSTSYLISPVDESGYLVPIVTNFKSNLTNSQQQVNLIRSFSTRSAYNSSAAATTAYRVIKHNRATICEQIGGSKQNEQEETNQFRLVCSKCCTNLIGLDNQAYDLFESSSSSSSSLSNTAAVVDNNKSTLFTCSACSKSTDSGPSNQKVVKTGVSTSPSNNIPPPPLHPAPNLPTASSTSIAQPPPLPLVPPPPLSKHNLQKSSSFVNHTSQHQSCSCNLCAIKTGNYFNSKQSVKPSSTPTKNSTDSTEPITYIDSQDIDENNNSGNIQHLRGITHNMNQILARLKSMNRHDVKTNKRLSTTSSSTTTSTCTTTNSATGSFEFIDASSIVNSADLIASYEKSWEGKGNSVQQGGSATKNTPIILLNNNKNSLIKYIGQLSNQPVSGSNNNRMMLNRPSSLLLLDNNTKKGDLFIVSNHHHNSSPMSSSNNAGRKLITSSTSTQSFVASRKNNRGNQSEQILTEQNSDDFERLLSSTSSIVDEKATTNDASLDLESLGESWYQPNIARESVHGCLINQEIGSFLIRLSSSCRNCYALSIRVPYFANQTGIAHYLITRNTRGGYKLKGVDKEFKSLKSLVIHHSVMQEILPVTLNLATNCLDQKETSCFNSEELLKSRPSSNLSYNNSNRLSLSHVNNLNTKNISCLIK